MANEITLKALQEASVDAKSLEEVVNGNDAKQVTTRLGESYPSVKKAIKTLFENGGLPATPFETKALMNASALNNGAYAVVTNEGANGGLYEKRGGVWVRSLYDAYGQTKEYLRPFIAGFADAPTTSIVDINSPLLATTKVIATNISGVYYWQRFTDAECLVINVAPSDAYVVEASGEGDGSYVIFYNSKEDKAIAGTKVATSTVVIGVGKNEIKTVIAPDNADTMLVSKTEVGYNSTPKKLSKLDKVILNTGNVIDSLDSVSSKMPLSAASGKILKDIIDTNVIIKDSVEVVIDDVEIRIKDRFVKKVYDKEGEFVWGYHPSAYTDELIVIPVTEVLSVTITAAEYVDGSVLFYDDIPNPQIGDSITSKMGFTRTLKNTTTEIPVPKGAKYVLVALIEYALLTRPRKITLNYSKAISSKDVIDTLPELGSSMPISANVVLELQRQFQEGIRKELPKVIPVGVKTSVFATHKNFILKDEQVDGISNIFVSRDLGVTWTNFVNTIGKITNFHFFVDGTIMLCGTDKIYTLNSDYTGLIESTVLDHDGSIFVPENPNNEHHFYSLIYGNQTQYVDGVEIFFWGEYRFNGAIRMWYTVDRGRTIKCAVKFGTTMMDGAVQNIRHVHMVTQRRQDEKFYFTTGDHGVDGAENMLITGKYNVAADTWDWKVLASGWLYKFGDIFFDEHYAYLLTDYTSVDERPLSGLYRVAVENLGDFSKYHAIFKPVFADMGAGTLSRYIEDSNGNKIIFPDNAGHGRLWIARGDMVFKYHTTAPMTSFMSRLGVNDLGDIYANDPFADPEPTGTMSQKLYINHGSHNLTKILRDAGLSNFMAQRALISDTWIR